MKSLSLSLKKLVNILNDGEFHSGAFLGKTLNISRNAIWKHINQLAKYGIHIESAQSKGYRLNQPLILLQSNLIKKNTDYSGKLYPDKIEILGSIPSTNDYLKHYRNTGTDTVSICLAEHQSAGKGRFGRSWHSPFGSNIYLSCGWRISKDVSKLSGLSLVIALSVIKALEQYGLKNNLAIKWPNDILWDDKKLAGILTEISAESHSVTQVIIGIGLNVNMPVVGKDEIDRPFASLNNILNAPQDRNIIAGLLITHLLQSLEKFDEYGFTGFMKQWKQYDYLLNKKTTLSVGKIHVKGTGAGIDEQGHLLLRDSHGEIKKYSAGEASLHSSIKNTSASCENSCSTEKVG